MGTAPSWSMRGRQPLSCARLGAKSNPIVLYRIVDFHHYVVAALIRKTRRPAPLRAPAAAR